MTLNSDALQVPGMITRRCCNSWIIIYANNWKKRLTGIMFKMLLN